MGAGERGTGGGPRRLAPRSGRAPSVLIRHCLRAVSVWCLVRVRHTRTAAGATTRLAPARRHRLGAREHRAHGRRHNGRGRARRLVCGARRREVARHDGGGVATGLFRRRGGPARRSACRARVHPPRFDGAAAEPKPAYTLTRGTFGTEPRGGDEPPSPPLGPEGLRRGRLRLGLASGIFSGLGVTGPSRYSKPSLSAPASSFTTITRTWPPALSLPNNTSSASAFLMCS